MTRLQQENNSSLDEKSDKTVGYIIWCKTSVGYSIFSLNMTAAQFDVIKKYILLKGDHQGFCNMYNDNPHMAFGNSDVY